MDTPSIPRKRKVISIEAKRLPDHIWAYLRDVLGAQPGDNVILTVGKRYPDAVIEDAVERQRASGLSWRRSFTEAAQELELHSRTVCRRYRALKACRCGANSGNCHHGQLNASTNIPEHPEPGLSSPRSQDRTR